MKDMGTQSYIWSGFGGVLAWLSEQQNLVILSLAVGLVTACANLWQRCQESKYRRRAEERAEEIHRLTVEKLNKRGKR